MHEGTPFLANAAPAPSAKLLCLSISWCACCVCSKKGSAAKADAVTLGDAWLAPAIASGLIRPIPGARDSDWWVRCCPPFLLTPCMGRATNSLT